ncbi:MAG TPA: alpha-hydroxy acid oxidase [Xanthobacteraceae bacterium]|jgi:glycolate oxidase|nr:alpha-hydroxy acid oxidase [Xanthobacteraceae bacterium]
MTKQNIEEATLLRDLANAPEFMNLHEVLAKARANLNQNDWDYIVGGVETETTLRRNRMALDSIAFRPRVLRDVSKVDASTELLGRKLRLPIVLCPVGSLESFHPGGAEPVVKAAAEFGIAHMLSSVCDPGLEEVAKAAPDGLRMFQLYVRGDAAWVDDYVARAIANKYSVFCLTVDTAHYSRRERDIAKRHITGGRRRASGREFQAALDWRTVERIKSKFKIPLAIKGIATAEDAKLALDHGVDFIYVSNHGGRQLDHGRGSTDVLPEVAEAVAGRAKIVIDGGFYRGSDIVKALALGANLVGLGRMQCYALAAAGQAGIVRMLELLEDEVIRTMGLLGVTSYGKLDSSHLHAAAPANPANVFSAFPLLDIAPYRY